MKPQRLEVLCELMWVVLALTACWDPHHHHHEYFGGTYHVPGVVLRTLHMYFLALEPVVAGEFCPYPQRRKLKSQD